jgi:hypothetical protein
MWIVAPRQLATLRYVSFHLLLVFMVALVLVFLQQRRGLPDGGIPGAVNAIAIIHLVAVRMLDIP